MKKLLIKKRCKCGAYVICKKVDHGTTPVPVCGRCKKYGFEDSRREQSGLNSKLNSYKK